MDKLIRVRLGGQLQVNRRGPAFAARPCQGACPIRYDAGSPLTLILL